MKRIPFKFSHPRASAYVGLLTCLVMLIGCSQSSLPPAEIMPNMTEAIQLRAKLSSGSAIASEGAAEATVKPTGFATLKGRFQLKGTPPANPTLSINKDLDVCLPGGTAVQDNVVLVGSDRGLANVLIYADKIDKDWVHPEMIGNTDTVDFDQKNCVFINRIFPIQTTQKIRILNSDPVGHNADIKPTKNLAQNPNIPGNGSAMYPPNDKELSEEASPFPVSCGAHTWMKSYMIFRKNGYFAVTKADGTFEIPNLPAGVPIKLVAWHEASRGIKGEAVEVNDVARGWNARGTFTVTLEPDSTTELQVAVNSAALTK